MTTPSLTKARRMIAAIDKRIDRVTAQLPPIPEDASAFDYQRALDRVPGLQGIQRSLYARRGHWQRIRDEHLWNQARSAERRAVRKLAAKHKAGAKAKHCSTCTCAAA